MACNGVASYKGTCNSMQRVIVMLYVKLALRMHWEFAEVFACDPCQRHKSESIASNRYTQLQYHVWSFIQSMWSDHCTKSLCKV